jgi:hypothetical protein
MSESTDAGALLTEELASSLILVDPADAASIDRVLSHVERMLASQELTDSRARNSLESGRRILSGKRTAKASLRSSPSMSSKRDST